MSFSSDRELALQLDRQDPLREFRAAFHIPARADGSSATYLCGHSLGLAPRTAQILLDEELRQWQTLGVEAHFEGSRQWVSYHEQLTAGLAALVGAHADEVVAMNSLSVNLHLMLVSFYRPTRERYKIVIEHGAFPSDRYAVASHLRWHGFDPAEALIELQPREQEDHLRSEDIEATLHANAESIATVMLPGVQYLSGQRLDMQHIAGVAHEIGAMVGFDLAHAIGNVPLRLHEWDVDFAVWCSYKYLNGGPGAIGGCFVHRRFAQAFDLPRFAGWWGHDKQSRFAMPDAFQPLSGAEGWQLSNPPIFAMAPLLAALQLFNAAGFHRLNAKAQQLAQYGVDVLNTSLGNAIVQLTPRESSMRGCQTSLRVRLEAVKAKQLPALLAQQGVICDSRAPDVIRFAAVPLYNSFEDVWTFVSALDAAVRSLR